MRSLFCVLLVLCSSVGTSSAEVDLEALANQLESMREATHASGLSLAIVKDDEVIFARGFGMADIANGIAADENTVYAVGSTTKAFASTLVGMLVDEGKIGWDDPVTDHLPYFTLPIRSDDPAAQCTVRDLLCHRTGFSRMGMLWISGELTREEVLRTAPRAEPWDDFRAGFHYCNVTYAAAGEASAAVVERSWEELMQERILGPLGMTASTMTVEDAREQGKLAVGYRWDEFSGEFIETPFVNLQPVGPAGSLNASVVDMAQWLRFLLGRGEFEGERLISKESLQETWTPQIEIGNGVSYGLGWMIRESGGHQIIEHDGNITGFSALFAMKPEENLGVVLLLNTNMAQMREAAKAMIFDAFTEKPLEVASEVTSDMPSEMPTDESVAAGEVEFDDYLGVYIADFASFRDERFEVKVNGDLLALNIPSQSLLDLKMPDAEGKWVTAATDQIAVSFQRDSSGAVVSLTVHQGDYNFEAPREGHSLDPGAPAAELEKYAGKFVLEGGDRELEFIMHNGLLTLEDRGNRVPLLAPDAKGHAQLRPRVDQGATFTMGADGRAESLIFHGNAGDRKFVRMGEGSDEVLPTIAEINALRDLPARIEALERAGNTRASGKVSIVQSGVEGIVTFVSAGADEFVTQIDVGRFGKSRVEVRGERAWSSDPMTGQQELHGDQLTQAILENPRSIYGDWSLWYDVVKCTGSEELDGRATWVVRLSRGEFPAKTFWVDQETGDVLRVNQIMVEGAVRIPVTTTLSQFEKHDGLRRAMRVRIENPASGSVVMEMEKVETGVDVGDGEFELGGE